MNCCFRASKRALTCSRQRLSRQPPMNPAELRLLSPPFTVEAVVADDFEESDAENDFDSVD
ncbi:hypothetical protein Hanom_Chr05g00433271 [Helianthus anomalus]